MAVLKLVRALSVLSAGLAAPPPLAALLNAEPLACVSEARGIVPLSA